MPSLLPLLGKKLDHSCVLVKTQRGRPPDQVWWPGRPPVSPGLGRPNNLDEAWLRCRITVRPTHHFLALASRFPLAIRQLPL
jgi:hypothetical protein